MVKLRTTKNLQQELDDRVAAQDFGPFKLLPENKICCRLTDL